MRLSTGVVVLLAAGMAGGAAAKDPHRAWRLYREGCEALLKGEARDKVGERFAAAAREEPESPIGKTAGELAAMLAEMAKEDASFAEPKDLAALSAADRLRYDLFKLRDVAAQALVVPGITRVLTESGKTGGPAHSLRRMGKAAVPALLALLEDRRPTRSIAGDLNGGQVLRYCDAALQILEAIAARRFDTWRGRGAFLSNAPETMGKEIRGRVAAWWAEDKEKTEAQWIRESLAATGVGAMSDRLASAERLIELEGAGCVEFFRERLKHEPESGHLIRLLWKAGGKASLDVFRAGAASGNFYVRAASYRALFKAGEPGTVETVQKELATILASSQDDDGRKAGMDSLSDYRASLASILIASGDPKGVAAAAKVILHQNPVVARDAIRVFGWALSGEQPLSAEHQSLVLPYMATALERDGLQESASWWIAKTRALVAEWPHPPRPASEREAAVQKVKAWWAANKERFPMPGEPQSPK